MFAAGGGGAGTVGVTVSKAEVNASTLADVARSAPDASPAAGLEGVLVATGAAWLVHDRHLVSVVLLDAEGTPAPPLRMRDLVRAMLGKA